jgi:hypothetical protein
MHSAHLTFRGPALCLRRGVPTHGREYFTADEISLGAMLVRLSRVGLTLMSDNEDLQITGTCPSLARRGLRTSPSMTFRARVGFPFDCFFLIPGSRLPI